jgi:hypothetical protein
VNTFVSARADTQRLRDEYAAAIAALDAAKGMTVLMLDAGMPIERLEVEFLAERQANAEVVAARRRLDELERTEVAAIAP